VSAISWVGELIGWFADLIPRLGQCNAKEAGVKFRRGKVSPIKPGMFLYWPVTTEVHLVEISRQTINLASQTVTTADGFAVLVSAVVVYRVCDPVQVLVEVSDWEDAIGDAALGAVVDVVGGMHFEEIRESLTTDVEKQIRHKVRLALKPFGVKVERAFLSDFAECKVYKVAGDSSPILET